MSKKHNGSGGELLTGRVKWFNDVKGFGFITVDDTDVFVHYSQINGSGHRTLEEGQEVQFEKKSGPKGSYAENVSILGA